VPENTSGISFWNTMRTYVKGRNTRFRSIPDSWVMAKTGNPRKNQCKILAHSCLVKCKGNFLGFHS